MTETKVLLDRISKLEKACKDVARWLRNSPKIKGSWGKETRDWTARYIESVLLDKPMEPPTKNAENK